MPSFTRRVLVSFALGLVVASARPAHAQYVAVDLGSLPDTAHTFALDINARGDVVGRSGFSTNGTAVLWTREDLQPIGSQGIFGDSTASAINNLGRIAGTTLTDTLFRNAFLYSDGVVTPLGTLPGDLESIGADINDRGDVVGSSFGLFGPPHAVLWEGGVMRALDGPPGVYGFAVSINNRGQITGSAGDVRARAFLWQDGTYVELPSLPGGGAAAGRAINERGEVAGIASTADGATHAVLWTAGGIVDLGTLPGDRLSFARGINNRGQVVGYSVDAAGRIRAFVWTKGRMSELPPLPGGAYAVAHAISDAGAVVGEATGGTADGLRAVRWQFRAIR